MEYSELLRGGGAPNLRHRDSLPSAVYPGHATHAYRAYPTQAYPTMPPHASTHGLSTDPRDLGYDTGEVTCMTTTTSLHDLAAVLHPASGRAHHPHHHPHTSAHHHQAGMSVGMCGSGARRDEPTSLYGTIRRGADRGAREGGGAPPHPRVVGNFLATSHQESAV